MDLAELPNGGFSSALIEKEIPIAGPGRIRLKNTENAVRTRQAYYTDLDINGHVNSIRYIEMMLDLFPCSSIKNLRPKATPPWWKYAKKKGASPW